MKMKKINVFLIVIVLNAFTKVYSQTNNLTGSPYSLFGLGVESNSNVGSNSGLGNTGVASDIDTNINIFNPALFATIPQNRFLFDVGFYGEIDNVSNGKDDEFRGTSNFSNISLAFNANGNFGMGLTLIPATNVGYALIGVKTEVEGIEQGYIGNTTGSGGLNTIRADYGRKLFNGLNFGFNVSYLFGKIEENEMVIVNNSLLKINNKNYYSGIQFGVGLQLKQNKYNLGFVLESPSVLNVYKDTNIFKDSDSDVLIIDQTSNESMDDFITPMKLKFGITTIIIENLKLNLDYKRSFWNMTDQEDNIGVYADQDIIGFGVEYTVDKSAFKYWKRINFRAGYNHDSGYLKIDAKKNTSNALSLGFGFPIGNNNQSFLNISYTHGKSGSTEGVLIEQNFNTINLNISLSDVWFIKRKYE